MSRNDKETQPIENRNGSLTRPPDYQVIFYKNSPHVLGDEVDVLSNIFGLSVEKAFFIIQQAAMDGEALIMESTREVIETRVAKAQDKFSRIIKERPDLTAFSVGVKEVTRDFSL